MDHEVGIRLRGYSNGDEITVGESRLRIDGSLLWHQLLGFVYGVRLNGEVIPYGCPYYYEYLQGRVLGGGHDEFGMTSFFVMPDLAEGRNVIEFTMFHVEGSHYEIRSVEGYSRKTIYVYYEP